jgi:hypothetical protein
MKKAAAIGCHTTVVPALLVIAGLLFAGDVFARRYATGQLSDRISAAVPEASGVHARVRSFPFVAKVVWDGKVDEVGAHIDRLAPVHGVVFTNLDLDMRGVVLDGDDFANSHQVTVTRIREGTVNVSVTAQALTDALGRSVHITGGLVNVAVLAGPLVRAMPALTPARQLVLRVAGLPLLAVPLPSVKVLPCAPQLKVGEGVLTLRCTFTAIPNAFVRVAA